MRAKVNSHPAALRYVGRRWEGGRGEGREGGGREGRKRGKEEGREDGESIDTRKGK